MSRPWHYILALLAGLIALCTQAQPPNEQWHDLLSYQAGKGLCATQKEVVLYTRQAIHSYRPETGLVERYYTARGLSTSGIVTIHHTPDNKGLLVSYEDGTIDIVRDRVPRTIVTHRENVSRSLDTPITCFANVGGQIYGITRSALIEIDQHPEGLKEQHIVWNDDRTSTLRLNDLTSTDEQLYIATIDGVYCPIEPLRKSHSFRRLGDLEGNITRIACEPQSHTLTAIRLTTTGYEIWLYANDAWQHLDTRTGQAPISLTYAQNSYLLCDGHQVEAISTEGNIHLLYSDNSAPPNEHLSPQMAWISASGTLYIASAYQGLIALNSNSPTRLSPPSPAFDRAYRIASTDNSVAFVAGRPTDQNGQPLQQFATFISQQGACSNIVDTSISNALCIALVPNEPGHILVGTEEDGLIEIRNGAIAALYNASNSSLQTDFSGLNTRVDGIFIAQDGSWWVHNPGNSNALSVRNPSGSWSAYPIQLAASPRGTRFILSPQGNIWMLTAGQKQIARIDPSAFLASGGKEGCAYFRVHFENNKRNAYIEDLAFDEAGNMWVANQRVLIQCRDADSAPNATPLIGSTIVVTVTYPYDDITSIAEGRAAKCILVDHGGHIWLGTHRAGLFQIDPKQKSVLRIFNHENSPLPSNEILDLALEDANGLLHICTDKGVLTLRADTQEPAPTYDNVRIYPQPIGPQYTGYLYIDGLTDNTNLKITNAAGQLVRELTSNGGRAQWDLRNRYGQPVQTGIYLIFCTNSTDKQTHIGKIAIVR